MRSNLKDKIIYDSYYSSESDQLNGVQIIDLDESSSEYEESFDVFISNKGFPEGNLIVVYDSYNTVSINDIKSQNVNTMSEIDNLESWQE